MDPHTAILLALAAVAAGELLLADQIRRIARSRRAELTRMRVEWTAIQLEIENVMEQLTRFEGRLNKRKQRSKKKAAGAQPSLPGLSPEPDVRPQKAAKNALRQRFFGAPLLVPSETQENGPQPEFESEDDE